MILKIKNTRGPFKRELHGMHTVKYLIFEKNDRGGPAPWQGLDGVTSGGVRPPRPGPSWPSLGALSPGRQALNSPGQVLSLLFSEDSLPPAPGILRPCFLILRFLFVRFLVKVGLLSELLFQGGNHPLRISWQVERGEETDFFPPPT